jgi:(p)ppGpp synthase/HD superfamily hydrolase
MDDILKQITDFADKAHGTQTRKYTPERYIVHPVRVMNMCKEYTDDIAVLAAALLHDVLEDTPVTKNEIASFLEALMDKQKAQQAVQLVVELTDVYIKKDYPQWNRRKRKAKEAERIEQTSPAAQTIKYADIIDNTTEIAVQDKDFAKVFLHECRAILKKINKGNSELYKKALLTVENAMDQLKRKPQV